MRAQAYTGKFHQIKTDTLAIAVFKNEKVTSGFLRDLDNLTDGMVKSVLKVEEFKGEIGESVFLRFPKNGKLNTTRILLVGVGEREEYQAHDVATFSGTTTRFLRKRNISEFTLMPRASANAGDVCSFAMQGVITSQFELDKYKTADKKKKFVKEFGVFIDGAKPAEMKEGFSRGQIIGDSINFTRDLSNEPPNILTPTAMAQRAQKMARECGLRCEILDEAKMKKLGMGSLLSVSLGSAEPAKLIVLRYTPRSAKGKKRETLAFVGKGITFDTGGISLKPSEGMEAMKYDMTGGGTVIGTMRAIGLLKPDIPVIGVVAAVENMPDGKASRPSDIVTAMTGKTVEILNTDAEGRLVLADAVAYAEKQGASRIVDMATLTGAVIIALGDVYTAVLGNDQKLIDEIIDAGKAVGEKFWQLPVGKEYSRGIKSDIADIKNIGPSRKAGTIIGAVFIQEFIKKAKWAHLDIAGTAWADDVKPHRAKGPTGIAIRTLLKLIE